MKAWEIWRCDFPFGPHWVVLISHQDRIDLKPDVVVLLCASKRTQRDPKPFEVILNEEDGMDWPTLCRCDLLYTVAKASLGQRKGAVTLERRRAIAERIIRSLAIVGI